LAFIGEHDHEIKAFHAQTVSVSQRRVLRVPWLQNLKRKIVVSQKVQETKNEDIAKQF
jgi:hypothetical protein